VQVWDVQEQHAAPQELVSRRDGLPAHGLHCCGGGGHNTPLVAVWGPELADSAHEKQADAPEGAPPAASASLLLPAAA
jgi:hypothetical protein